jgi:segregation and condensation protein B
MEKSNLKSVLESLLFVSGEPVKIGKLAKICNTAKNDIEDALLELDAEFQKEERGLSIIKKGDFRPIGDESQKFGICKPNDKRRAKRRSFPVFA